MGPQQLLEQFAAEYRREGSADPRPYLAQVEGADRTELQVLIESFLERAPRRRWDPEAFSGSVAERALGRAGVGTSGPVTESLGWPELLPALRNKVRLSRRSLVERLAVGIGFAEEEERVAAYYHRMERGNLRPSGVSSRVLDALALILGETAERLRRSGEAGQRAAETGGEVFARLGAPREADAELGPDLSASERETAKPPDELDRLFTGGEQDVR